MHMCWDRVHKIRPSTKCHTAYTHTPSLCNPSFVYVTTEASVHLSEWNQMETVALLFLRFDYMRQKGMI